MKTPPIDPLHYGDVTVPDSVLSEVLPRTLTLFPIPLSRMTHVEEDEGESVRYDSHSHWGGDINWRTSVSPCLLLVVGRSPVGQKPFFQTSDILSLVEANEW